MKTTMTKERNAFTITWLQFKSTIITFPNNKKMLYPACSSGYYQHYYSWKRGQFECSDINRNGIK